MNLNNVSRATLQRVLENHGYAVYDSEDTESLRHTVAVDLASGEIDESELED